MTTTDSIIFLFLAVALIFGLLSALAYVADRVTRAMADRIERRSREQWVTDEMVRKVGRHGD